MVTDLIVGSVCILFGIWVFVSTYRYPATLLTGANWKGYAGGIILIVIGIMCLIGKGGNLVAMFK